MNGETPPARPRRDFPNGGPWTWGAPQDLPVYGWTPGAPPPDLHAPPPPPPLISAQTQPMSHAGGEESSRQDPGTPYPPGPGEAWQDQPANWEVPSEPAPPEAIQYNDYLPPPLGPALTPEERYHYLHQYQAAAEPPREEQ